MRMPFQKLMELVDGLSEEEKALPMGELADRWGEPTGRIADAIDAVRTARGEQTYISFPPSPL